MPDIVLIFWERSLKTLLRLKNSCYCYVKIRQTEMQLIKYPILRLFLGDFKHAVLVFREYRNDNH